MSATVVPGEDASRLDVRGVTKRFGRITVLRDAAMTVGPGEVHALVGHNGSGKSTFVKVLAGYHTPEPGAEGTVDVFPLEVGNAQSAFDLGLRFVHQDLGLVDTLDAVDNILLGSQFPTRAFGRVDWSRARREAAEILEELGYRIDVRCPVARLSLADRTGIALARALHQAGPVPRVLVLDETTAALSSTAVEHLFGVIRRLSARGLGIIYISHHLEEIFAIADRVTVLRDGNVVGVESIADLDEAGLIELMVGSALHPGEVHRPAVHEGRVALAVRGLSTGAIRDLDLDVAVGEVVGIAGLPGSGRDELAGALFGSVPRRGDVTVLDRELPRNRPDVAIRLGLGLLPADRARNGLFPDMTIRENLTMPMLPTRFGRSTLDVGAELVACRAWLEELEVRPPDPERRISELSGGNQQKILLARWLRLDPSVLLLDEPTQGVDVATVDRIYGMVRRAAATGTSFVVCSSDTDELVEIADRVVVFCRGTVRRVLRGPEITREAIDTAALTFSEGVGT